MIILFNFVVFLFEIYQICIIFFFEFLSELINIHSDYFPHNIPQHPQIQPNTQLTIPKQTINPNIPTIYDNL